MQPFQPVRFGKYLLLDKIAVGGMAELYRAKIIGVQGFEKLIAVKRILPHLTTEDELITSFIDEAKLAALLNHPNIVQIYDFGNMESSYFLAMEYLIGKDLRFIAKRSKERDLPLGLEHALFIASRVCSALEYAHNLKDFQGKPLHLVHRDISPQNVFITYDGQVKIVDFGIAKAATQSTMTQVGMIKGKVAYMSPEQAEGKAIDHRSDIFAAGTVLYEMLTGNRMLEGDTLTILTRLREGQYVPPGDAIKDLPSKLKSILERALAKDLEDRYQSSADMLADLEECLYDLSLRPSARGLSLFMKDLFKEEIDQEEKIMHREETERDASLRQTEAADTAGVISRPGEVTVVIPKEETHPAGDAKRKGLVYGGLAAGLVAVILVIALFVGRGTESTKDKPIFENTKGPATTETVSAPSANKAPGPPPPESKGEKGPASANKAPAPPPPESKVEKGPASPGPSAAPPAAPVPAATKELDSKLAQALKDMEAKQYSEAALLFDQLLVMEPSLLDRVAQPYARALQELASEVTESQPEKAKALLLKSVELDPGNAQANYQLGLVYVKLKDFDNAKKAFQIVAELNPTSADAFFNLGYAQAVTKDYIKAEEMYKRVVALAPSYLDEALYNLALVQDKEGKREQCIANLQKALSVNPQNQLAKEYLSRVKGRAGGSK
jgi:serine/threonine protein kinase/Flp pilus assembly protein TadD